MDLNVLLFSPADSIAERAARAARVVEEFLPGTSLAFTANIAGALQRLPDRDAFLRQAAGRQEFPILTDADRSRPVVLSGVYWAEVIAPGGVPLLQVILQTSRIPAEESARAGTLLGRLGDALSAIWGVATPVKAAGVIGAELAHDPRHDRAVPLFLGWWNYWSGETVERLNHRPAGATTLASGAMLWAVTEEPLDLQRTDHRAALAEANARWPQIAGKT